MMKYFYTFKKKSLVYLYAALCFSSSIKIFSQAENVPVHHPVYQFLERMNVRGFLQNYNNVVLPLSRKEIAMHLMLIQNKPLHQKENALLKKYFVEFENETNENLSNSYSLFSGKSDAKYFNSIKHLYTLHDSNASITIDGLLNIDYRQTSKQNERAGFVEFGGRARGTFANRFGFYLQGTNAEFRGDRDVLLRDKRLRANFKIYDTAFRNFDFTEGYLRYDADIFSFQLGRERILWGSGIGERLILSDHPPQFDFVVFKTQYQWLQYNFLHGWILPSKSSLIFLPQTNDFERTLADKYIAVHRIGITFSRYFDFGINEMVIYSNRSVDAAYLNPFIFFESVQRARKERDNTFLVFDFKSSLFDNFQIRSSLMFDDINFKTFGTNSWDNRWAMQGGFLFAEPFTLENTMFRFEYTRIEPYVFSHGRSRENNYSHDGYVLGTSLQPNSENYFIEIEHQADEDWSNSVRMNVSRHGKNIDSANGNYRNVGGDFLLPHRKYDAEKVKFLDGRMEKNIHIEFVSKYEFIRDYFVEVQYAFSKNSFQEKNIHLFHFAVRMDL